MPKAKGADGQRAAPRPVLIDERDGPCEMCAAHESGKCDSCGQKIGQYENMGGAGFQSVKPSHFHLRTDGANTYRVARWDELCEGCYKEHRASIYPGEKKRRR